ncbi:MAG: hypothetical protein PHV77_04960 [Candidatus Omnitrophica bacterium]|jgi:hypothetical protein|nr:hypothetical protein [Candidatus Omnitrophota bacterium]
MKYHVVPKFFVLIIIAVAAIFLAQWIYTQNEARFFKVFTQRLTADSRVAEVTVCDVKTVTGLSKPRVTIRFVEYDTNLKPLDPKYFTFSNDLIQFQSLVVRFSDSYVKKADPLRGKSIYLFMKVFTLTDTGAEVFNITGVNDIPSGYRIEGLSRGFQEKVWKRFWEYALDPAKSQAMGIKNAQIEAPGTRFVPGMVYTIKIEHDGGLRIDADKPSSARRTS